MAIAVTNTKSVAVEIETTEGTYVAPAGSSSFVQTLDSGFEIKESKETLNRSVYTGTIGQVTPLTGTRSVEGSLPTECRAHSTEGAAPEFDKLMRSALGTKRQNTTAITTGTGNTDSVLKLSDADAAKLSVGDIILAKESGAHHVSPIVSKDSTPGSASVTLLIAHPDGAMSDGVVISKFTTYTVAESGHPTLSITEYLDSAIMRSAMGCRVNKVDLTDFATGKIPSLNFGFAGIDFDRKKQAPTYTPSYDGALPPIVLDGRVFMDDTSLSLNELSVSIENTVGQATALDKPNGKVGSRLTGRSITGSINPYQDTTDITNYEKFVANTEFSLFAYAKNDSETAGEIQNVVAVYMPKCIITELSQGDADGLVQESINFTASRGAAGTTNEIYICFI